MGYYLDTFGIISQKFPSYQLVANVLNVVIRSYKWLPIFSPRLVFCNILIISPPLVLFIFLFLYFICLYLVVVYLTEIGIIFASR